MGTYPFATQLWLNERPDPEELVLLWESTSPLIFQPHFPCFVLRVICVSFPEAIRRKVELEWGTEDEEYLEKVERNVRRSLQEHLPDVVVYNAGTDVLEGDRLGGLSISPAVCPNIGGRLGNLPIARVTF